MGTGNHGDLDLGYRYRGRDLAEISPAFAELSVFSILRPTLLLPNGIVDCLMTQEMDAIVAHELCHIRRRHNLITAIHMVVESLFWFHPLVWWVGARLMEDRERRGPAMKTGGDLKKRIEAIVGNHAALKLNYARKAVLTRCHIEEKPLLGAAQWSRAYRRWVHGPAVEDGSCSRCRTSWSPIRTLDEAVFGSAEASARQGRQYSSQQRRRQSQHLHRQCQNFRFCPPLSMRQKFADDWAQFKSVTGSSVNNVPLTITIKPEHYPFWSRDRSRASLG